MSVRPVDWRYFSDRFSELPDITSDLKSQATNALTFLEKELGGGFFKTCGRNHPVWHRLMMAGGEGQIAELVKWVQVLQTLKSTDSNYPRLLQKLHSKSEARVEAIPFIELSARHLAEDFSIYFPEEKQGQKNADIELTYNRSGEKIFVEVTRISEGDEQEKKEALYHQLLNFCQCSGYNVLVAGKLYKLAPEQQLIEKLRMLMAEAAQGVKLIAYEDQYLSVAFAQPDRLAELDEWCAERKLSRRFDGFDVKFDYTSRMIKNSRLRREVKQIPAGRPGMIYCPVHILYMQTMNVAETVARFAAELEKYKNIFGLVFYGEVMPPLGEPFLVDDPLFTYAMQRDRAHVARYTLLIKNPSFELQLSAAAKTALVNAAI